MEPQGKTQHAVPQQISSYQFRLVGDMTIKQFFEVAGGALISLLIYATGLPFIIKWPLIIFFILFGAALAFVPLEERPLEEWLLAFVRSVYSPTQFTWQHGKTKDVFAPESAADTQTQPAQSDQDTLATTDTTKPKGVLGKFEEAERAFLQKIGQITAASTASAPTTQTTNAVSPPTQQASNPSTVTADMITTPGVQHLAGDLRGTVGAELPNNQQTQQSGNGNAGVSVPETGVVTVDRPKREQSYVAEQAPVGQGEVYSVDQILSGQASVAAQQARFSQHAAPPEPPTQPNTIVGQVLDPEGRIVEGAILEVKDQSGRPVRALKTNKAGHFMVVTPLLPGTYQIITEKEGLSFDPVEFLAENKVIGPIAVKAKTQQ